MKRIQIIWVPIMLLLVISCLSGCGKEAGTVTAEELLDGIHLSMEDPVRVSIRAEVSGEVKNASGAAVSVPAVSVPAEAPFEAAGNAVLESTGRTVHVTGNGSVNGTASDFEAYLADTGTGYDCYARMGQGEWTYSTAGKDSLAFLSADAGLVQGAEERTTETGYEVTGQVELSDMVNDADPESSGIEQPGAAVSGSSVSGSAFGIDPGRLTVKVKLSFGKDKQLASILAEAGGSDSGWEIKLTMDLDRSGDIQVQIPGDVQGQASAGAALGEGDLLQANGIRAETSEEFAALLGFDYQELEDEEKLLISNMLYYLGGNERVKEACRNWGTLPESDKKALAAIVERQYISSDALAAFGASESELDTFAENNLP